MRRRRAVAPLAALALAVTACGSGSSGSKSSVDAGNAGNSGNTGNSGTIAGLHANNHGTMDVTGKSTVKVEAGSYYFEPSVLKGTPGQQLTLHVVNETGTGHNLSVGAEHVNDDIDGHGTVDAKVTMPASGVLSFWCEYHKNLGMVGGLLVSGSASDAPAGGAPAPSSSSSSGGGSGYGGYGNGGG